MKISLTVCILLLLSTNGCKVQKDIINKESNIFNYNQFNKKHSVIVSFNLKYEPDLLDTIKLFKRKNANAELEDIVILEFLELQRCVNEEGPQFQDYPNKLQSIFDFYYSMSKKELEWLNYKELNILRFTSVKFLVNHANNNEAIEYLKIELNNCKDDINYAKFVMSSSNLNECIEKRR